MMRRLYGFTLIELLIVVAIIAILAAIAVPNFLEAQTRSKVSRARADMASVATAVELYRIDNNSYPPMCEIGYPKRTGNVIIIARHYRLPSYLSTPIAYITSLPHDPFSTGSSLRVVSDVYTDTREIVKRYTYYNTKALYDDFPESPFRERLLFDAGAWLLHSYGPDKYPLNIDSGIELPWDNDTMLEAFETEFTNYDATNGTISNGNIFRTQRNPAMYQES